MGTPVMIVDGRKGTVHLLYCIEGKRCYYKRSDDDGKNWSNAEDITYAFDAFRTDQLYDWKQLGCSRGHGIQLKNGRLLVPVWLMAGVGTFYDWPSAISVIYSDPGQLWKRGDIVAKDPTPLADPIEACAVQLNDGATLFSIRHQAVKPPHFRAVARSDNGITGWSKPKLDRELPEADCRAGMCRLTEKPTRILFANLPNAHSQAWQDLTVKLSYDECDHWKEARLVEQGPCGSSDLAVGPDGTIYCFYEHGTMAAPATLRLARFNLEWLTRGKDHLDRK
jgi:sialidase-1